MIRLKTYPKVHHLGDPMLDGILDGKIIVEEKIDGSQFRIKWDADHQQVECASRRVEFKDNGVEGSFKKIVDHIEDVFKNLKWDKTTYLWGEYLGGVKQNSLVYERVPKNNLMIFDGFREKDGWFNHEMKEEVAKQLDVECVAQIWDGDGKDFTSKTIDQILKKYSALGPVIPEGIVVKNYGKYFDAGKYSWMEGWWMVGKFVRKEFQELNKASHLGDRDKLANIKATYNNEARWNKAVQKLKDEGKLEHNMRDMAFLIREVMTDVTDECSQDIKDRLFKIYGRDIVKSSTRGLAEFYNKKLLEDAIH